MKYLKDMTDEEIIRIAETESIQLEMDFSRGRIIEKLVSVGYIFEEESKALETKEGVIRVEQSTLIEEIDIDDDISWNFKSRRFYRNFINKKKMRKIKKRYRFKKNEFKSINFEYEGLNHELIKRRELETEIENSKFSLGQETKKEIEVDRFFDRAPLPASYFVDEIVLMPKNTTTLFAYWEIRDDTFKKLSEENNIVDNIVIKLLKNGQECIKIIRHERIGSHYINNIDVNESYEAIIGYEDVYGNFIEIAHSTQSMVPRNTVSNNFDLKWLTVVESPTNKKIIKFEPIIKGELSNIEKDDYIDGGIIRKLVTFGSSENGILEECVTNPDNFDINETGKIGSSFIGSSFNGSSFNGSSKSK